MSNKKNTIVIESDEPIHEFFELSYAEYLVVPRSVLQSMPVEWQKKMRKLLDELWEKDWHDQLPEDTVYRVQLYKVNESWDDDTEHTNNPEDYWVKPVDDPLGDYERGRRRIKFSEEVKNG